MSSANERILPGPATSSGDRTDTQHGANAPADDGGDVENHQLWKSFAEASGSGSAPRIAAAEDAVFRHHLPWARSLAAAESPDDPDDRELGEPVCSPAASRVEYQDAAEVGLAQAILAWNRTGSGRFVDFARRSILRRIRRLPIGISDRRLYGRAPSRTDDAFDAVEVINHDATTVGSPADAEVALLDRDGTIVWVNDAWKAFGEANGATPARTGVGVSYLAVCDAAQGDPYAELVARAIRRAANGQRTTPVTARIPCDAPNCPRWYDVLITPRTNEDSELVGVAVALSLVSPTIWEIPTQMAVAT